jgi:exopolyphosphatase/guanosine-5'-triphosphate,3'-diphosphate pyrophosphatase
MIGELRGSDVAIVREQLGRDPTTPFTVTARCNVGHPLVIRNEPFDPDGAPFPTRFWLTCRVASKAVSRLESQGAISELNARVDADPGFADAVAHAHAAYATERARGHPEAEAFGGVGGTRRGIKCLHAHYANHLAGAEDVVGAWVGERVEPIHAERDDRFAVMDQGTNSTRLLVAEPTADGGFVDLARDLVITRLGQGVDGSGRLAPQALERVLDVVDRYVGRARALHARTIRMTATAAVRDASNRDELARAIAERTGSPLEIASGEQEAELSFVGATRGLEADAPFLVVDIGGGSTEFVLGTDRPAAAISVQMGSVRLTERFVRHDPPTRDETDAIAAFVGQRLEDVRAAVPVADARTLVAVAGTSTTVQAIALGLDRYDPDRIHRSWLSTSDAERVADDLAAMSTAERAALPVMAPGRADVIATGARILVTLMRDLGFERALVSETDILDGLADAEIEDGLIP